MSAAKRMGSLSKLSDFGVTTETEEMENKIMTEANKKTTQKAKGQSKTSVEEKNVPINIKVTSSQQKWLAATAQQVRSNNESAVAAADRVFPQHLIQVAIDLLKAQGVDWQEVKDINEIREFLNI